MYGEFPTQREWSKLVRLASSKRADAHCNSARGHDNRVAEAMCSLIFQRDTLRADLKDLRIAYENLLARLTPPPER